MAYDIDTLKAALKGGGARPNFFKIEGLSGFPAGQEVLVKAASLPASIIDPITVPFMGRQLQVAGDRKFEPWTITVINDTDNAIRNYFEDWSNSINDYATNVATGGSNPSSYEKDVTVHQLGRGSADEILNSYTFKGVWVNNISAIELSYDTENTIEEFTIELQVQYWTKS